MKVTETHKWHISGHIVDASPIVPHVEAKVYFEGREKQRQKEREEEEKAKNTTNDIEKPQQEVIEVEVIERVLVKNSMD